MFRPEKELSTLHVSHLLFYFERLLIFRLRKAQPHQPYYSMPKHQRFVLLSSSNVEKYAAPFCLSIHFDTCNTHLLGNRLNL
ncbi:hypothetical protein D3C87_1556540 [compost metagenome]